MNLDLHPLISFRHLLPCVPQGGLPGHLTVVCTPNNLYPFPCFGLSPQEYVLACWKMFFLSPRDRDLACLDAWHILLLLNLKSKPVSHVRSGHNKTIKKAKLKWKAEKNYSM